MTKKNQSKRLTNQHKESKGVVAEVLNVEKSRTKFDIIDKKTK